MPHQRTAISADAGHAPEFAGGRAAGCGHHRSLYFPGRHTRAMSGTFVLEIQTETCLNGFLGMSFRRGIRPRSAVQRLQAGEGSWKSFMDTIEYGLGREGENRRPQPRQEIGDLSGAFTSRTTQNKYFFGGLSMPVAYATPFILNQGLRHLGYFFSTTSGECPWQPRKGWKFLLFSCGIKGNYLVLILAPKFAVYLRERGFIRGEIRWLSFLWGGAGVHWLPGVRVILPLALGWLRQNKMTWEYFARIFSTTMVLYKSPTPCYNFQDVSS